MFEDSLVASQVRHTSSPERWTALVSISLQFVVVALVIALPLLHPERLTCEAATPHILLPPPLRPPIPIRSVQAASSDATASSAQTLQARPMQRKLFSLPNNNAPSIAAITSGSGMADGTPISMTIGDTIHTPHVAIASAPTSKNPVRISSGVSAGMLLAPIRPIYPEIARAAHVEGTIVVEATISRTGAIESLRVISGPAMLQPAAIDAIRKARYQPYRLNGSPTEVQTTISVNFRLGS